MLVRRFVNVSFRLLLQNDWDSKTCRNYNTILTDEGGPLWWAFLLFLSVFRTHELLVLRMAEYLLVSSTTLPMCTSRNSKRSFIHPMQIPQSPFHSPLYYPHFSTWLLELLSALPSNIFIRRYCNHFCRLVHPRKTISMMMKTSHGHGSADVWTEIRKIYIPLSYPTLASITRLLKVNYPPTSCAKKFSDGYSKWLVMLRQEMQIVESFMHYGRMRRTTKMGRMKNKIVRYTSAICCWYDLWSIY